MSAARGARSCSRCSAPLHPGARVCAECGELTELAGGAHPAPAPPAPQERAWATTDLNVGEVLENTWRLDQIVGRGGMGAVFAATDLRLGRMVAVKALSAQLADEEFVSRFEREARVLGILDHPNIVTLHWVGRHQNVPFIVMKYLEGQPLRQWVEGHGGTLSTHQMLQVARQICSALAYVHEKGVVHRDLKPSNIMVAPNDHLTVFDLGIARPHDSNLTKTGIIFGTPGYMSPELIVGDKNLDGRLDLYALGVILYELLTGQAPFQDAHEESLLRAHLMKPRPDACALRPDLPRDLGAVLQKAMAVDPHHRFPDADELLASLEAACGVRQFHEAATIRRAPLRPGEPPPQPLPDAPDVTPKQVQAPGPEAVTESPPPSGAGATRLARPTPIRSPEPPPPVAPAAPPRAADLPTDRRPPLKRAKSREQVPRRTSRPELPAQPARPPPRPRRRPAALEDEDLLPDLPPFWQRRKVQVAAAAGAAVFLLLVLGVIFFPKGGGPTPAVPVPRVAPSDLPPPPPPAKKEDAPVATKDILERKARMEEVREQTVDTQRIRRVKPRVRRASKSYLGVRGRKTHGEIDLNVTVNGQPVYAEVWVDKEPIGLSPVMIPVKGNRKHVVRVKYESFPVSKFTTLIPANRSIRLEIELQPYGEGPTAPEVAVDFEDEEGGDKGGGR